MIDIAELGLSIRSDGVVVATNRLDRFTASGKRSTKATDRMIRKFKSLNRTLGLVAIAGSAAMTAYAASSIKLAVAAEETASKFQVVFRGSVERANAELIKLSRTVPMTITEMRAMAASVQDMLVPMGLARDYAAGLSVQTIKLAGDIASFNNVKPEEALRAIQSALAGQSEPLRRYGIDVSQTRLKSLAFKEGLIGVKDELNNAARAQATFIAITKDSSDAMGDAERTMNSTANQLKFMQRDINQAKEDLGQVLIPALRNLLSVVNEVEDDGFTPLQKSMLGISKAVLIVVRTISGAVAGFHILLNEIKNINDAFSVKLTGTDWFKIVSRFAGPPILTPGAMVAGVRNAKDVISARADQQSGEVDTLAKRATERAAELEKKLEPIFATMAGLDAAIAGLNAPKNRGLGEAQNNNKLVDNITKEIQAKEKLKEIDTRLMEVKITGQRMFKIEYENAGRVAGSLRLELELQKLSNVERQKRLALMDADATASSKYGQAISAMIDQVAANDDQIRRLDTFRSAFSDMFVDIADGSKSAKSAFNDFMSSMQTRILRMISERWVDQLFGAFGSTQTGSAGGFIANFFSSMFGGGKASGGYAYPGKFYEVNEQGRPEMFDIGRKQYLLPTQGGNVVPIKETKQDQPTVTNITLNLPPQSSAYTARQIANKTADVQRVAVARNR